MDLIIGFAHFFTTPQHTMSSNTNQPHIKHTVIKHTVIKHTANTQQTHIKHESTTQIKHTATHIKHKSNTHPTRCEIALEAETSKCRTETGAEGEISEPGMKLHLRQKSLVQTADDECTFCVVVYVPTAFELFQPLRESNSVFVTRRQYAAKPCLNSLTGHQGEGGAPSMGGREPRTRFQLQALPWLHFNQRVF